MNGFSHKKKLIWVCLFGFFFQTECRFTERIDYNRLKGTGSLRLIDHLTASDVISSPFIGILKKFPTVEENLSGRLIPYSSFPEKREIRLSATTQHSILGYGDKAAPEGMEVFLNNRKLNFWTESKDSDVQWKWVDTQSDLNIHFDRYFNPIFKCMILEENDVFTFDAPFPDAEVEIKISARRNWHPLNLDVRIDGHRTGGKSLGKRYSTYTLPVKIPPGVHTVSLSPRISSRTEKQQAGPTPPRILINSVQIQSRSDIILFHTPTEKRDELLSGDIKVKYLSDRTEAGEEHPYLDLYKLKHDPAYDLPCQKENPEKVKKKIIQDNLSFDALMAPPKSKYVLEVKIPPCASLEFGIGIFRTKKEKSVQSVNFMVDIEADGQCKRLCEKKFVSDSSPMHDQMVFEDIDLTDFSGRNVKLIFSTENKSPGRNVLAFWHNPVITRPSPQNPKIILISLDTLRADHLGCYGYGRNTSPNLDALAMEGVLFTHTYAQSSWTLPSHVSLLYSLNSASHQIYYADQKIDTELPSIADYLKKNGYQTSAITSGGYVGRIFGFDDGFDWYDEPLDKSKDPLGKYEAERLYTHTSKWLEKNKDKQFFLFLHTYQTHGPYHCPSPWNDLFLEKEAEWQKMDLTQFWTSRGKNYTFSPSEIANVISLYDGEIRYTDEMLIKPLVDLLKRLDIYDHTLLLITSDHGEEFYEHKGWLHGKTLYDESIRVPLIIKFPHSELKGKKVTMKCRLIDIMPTVLDMASVNYDKSLIEGKSLMDPILGKEKKHRSFISDLSHQNMPVPCPALIAGNRDNLKIIITKSSPQGKKGIEVYDLERDPREQVDRFRDYGKVIRDFVKMIEAYYTEKKRIFRNISPIKMDEQQKEKLRALGYIH